MFASWQDFYRSDLQAVYLLWIAPATFLAWRLLRGRPVDGGAEPRAAGFLHGYAIVFASETLVDPFATGPVSRWLGLQDPLATLFALPFVLLGDFRVFLLIFFLSDAESGVARALRKAAAWTLAVPIFAWVTNAALGRIFSALPSQSIWIVYELGFLAMALFLRASWIPRRTGRVGGERLGACLRALAGYAALYYALWACADLLVVLGGADFGWGLRVVPNQLYYSFWLPFAYGLFFSRRYASTSSVTQTSR